jgi:hypothetical protein
MGQSGATVGFVVAESVAQHLPAGVPLRLLQRVNPRWGNQLRMTVNADPYLPAVVVDLVVVEVAEQGQVP